MDCFDVLATQFQWLANVSMTTVSDMCPNDFYTVSCWLLILIVIAFIPPLLYFLLLYMMFLSAYVYKWCVGLSNTSTDDKAWDKFKYYGFRFFHCYGRLYHGCEIEGFENIPSEGGALIVAYHGPIIVDILFLLSEVYLSKHRLMRPVFERLYFDNSVGLGLALKVIKAIPGTIETCSNVVKDGHLMIVAPGGGYECLFGNNYQLQWRNRMGYAKVAIEAKSPIIPVFTVNIREAYETIQIGQSWLKKFYLKFRFPYVPMYGGLPVKLRTIIGKPIAFDPALTAEELNSKVLMSMEQLIKDNQRVPGSIPMALLDRFRCQKKVKGV